MENRSSIYNAKSEQACDRPLDNFDLAPIGYLTLTDTGAITEINLTGAALLGIERGMTQQHHFANFVTENDIDRWQRHFVRTLENDAKQHCELALLRIDGHLFHARLDTVPIKTDGKATGVRMAFCDITESKVATLELEKSRKLLRELAARNETLLEEERKRIAREVHDELGQLLSALRMDISLQRIQFAHLDPALMKTTQNMLALTDRIIGEVRNVATNLRPPALDAGILPALSWLCDEFNHHTAQACTLLISNGPIELDNASTTALFRIVQESLTNVMRYAEASSVEITIGRQDDSIITKVSDDGKGFDSSAITQKKSFGLLGMRERALAVGGDVEVTSTPAQGTIVSIRIPLNSRERI